MTDKAYIVANKTQELDVLKKFEKDGLDWLGGETPTDWIPSETVSVSFPYALVDVESVFWRNLNEVDGIEIVYDGRKEDKMTKKYKVTQKFMNELIKWRNQRHLDMENESYYATFKHQDFRAMTGIILEWQFEEDNPIERNNRLIAIIQWLNGEDVFEVENPHKFVVRNNKPDGYGDYYYVQVLIGVTNRSLSLAGATKFNTREEAQEWANSHQAVIEIDEDGN